MNARKICLGLAVALAMTAGVAVAQPEVEWERTYHPRVINLFVDMIQNENEELIIAGNSSHQMFAPNDFHFAILNLNGDMIYSRAFDNGNNDLCNGMIRQEDEGYILAGNSAENIWLLKLDVAGDSIWSRFLNDAYYERCWKISATSDGGFAIIGEATFRTGYDSYTDSLMIRRFNSAGELLWGDLFPKNRSGVSAFRQSPDGGFYMLTQNDLIKTNQFGEIEWTRTYEYGLYDMIQTHDNGFALLGSCAGGGQMEQDRDIILIRTDEAGQTIWNGIYGGIEHGDSGFRLIENDDQGFTIAGSTFSFGGGQSNGWLVRTNSEGDSLWSAPFGGNGHQGFNSVWYQPSGNYILGGYCEYDFYLVKTTPDPASVREPQVVAPFALHLAQPYPNPFNSTVTIPFGVGAHRDAPLRLAIFDPLGRRVADLLSSTAVSGGRFHPTAERGATTHSVIWDANGMPAGQYIVRLEAGNQQLSQRLSLMK